MPAILSTPAPFVSHGSWRRRYTVAVLAFAAALVTTVALRTLSTGREPVYSVFAAAAIVAAWYGGLGPGLVTGALAVLANVAAVAISGAATSSHAVEPMRMVAFYCTVVLMSVLADARNRALTRLGEQAQLLQRAERAVRESEERFRSLADGAPIVIWVTDARGGNRFVNRNYSEFFGVPREHVEGSRWQPLVHPDDADRYLTAFQQAVRQRVAFRADARMRRADGEWRWMSSYAEPRISTGGEFLGHSGVSLDLTDRLRAEEALQAANARLAEADRQKNDFIAILSHELRNPLAPVRYAVPLLKRERLGEAAHRAVEVIGRQVDQLTRLVDDLLDVSRITRGKVELRPQYVTLSAVIDAAVEATTPALTAARHRLSVDVPQQPIWLHADPVRLEQIITNLLDNSIKYTPRGGQVALKAGREGGQAVVTVSDSGIGIPADALSTVFEIFQQAMARVEKAQGGLGIGLAVVKRLVEMHGGTVEARSAGAGHGSQFVVRLPIAEDVHGSPPSEEAPVTASHRRLKVLIVDDNADLLEMLGTAVANLGHDVRRAMDGASAVSAAVAYRPDVVLLDLGLPILSGIEVARELRRRAETKNARLVALTGWGQIDDRRETREAGFAEHLTKPTDPEKLERLLAEFAAASA